MVKLTENMIHWAESKLGSTEYAGWCLDFIEDALEISNNIEVFGGDFAKESCELYKDALQGGVPERGAFVFYDCLCPSENGPVNWGHCGISFGDGRVIIWIKRVKSGKSKIFGPLGIISIIVTAIGLLNLPNLFTMIGEYFGWV